MMRRAAEVMAGAASVQDFCEGLERDAGTLLRLSGNVWPTMYHAATVTEAELARARGIGRTVREGHVQAVEPGGLRLQGGIMRVPDQALFIDCTALARGGLRRRAHSPAVRAFSHAEPERGADRCRGGPRGGCGGAQGHDPGVSHG
jgi:hypothetical protein